MSYNVEIFLTLDKKKFKSIADAFFDEKNDEHQLMGSAEVLDLKHEDKEFLDCFKEMQISSTNYHSKVFLRNSQKTCIQKDPHLQLFFQKIIENSPQALFIDDYLEVPNLLKEVFQKDSTRDLKTFG